MSRNDVLSARLSYYRMEQELPAENLIKRTDRRTYDAARNETPSARTLAQLAIFLSRHF